MFARLLAVAFVATLSTAAYAQSSPSTAEGSSEAGQSTSQALPQELRSKLQQDGFTDIKIVPGSFLVSAKDKNGDPVNMVIGPHSMMMLTEVSPNDNSNMNTGRSSTGSQENGSSSTNGK